MQPTVTVLGIDPGSRITGYGVVQIAGSRLNYVASGIIRTSGDDFTDRLKIIFEQMSVLIATHDPDEIAVEKVFVARNADSALKLGHARAAAICASFGAPVPISEYAAREVKQAVTGTGSADKEQVQSMVMRLLSLRGGLKADASDALAVAVCHAHMRKLASLADGQATGKRRR